MKKVILQPVLVLLFLAVIGLLVYIIPLALSLLTHSSYKFVTLFLLLIIGSNILAKIATTYINL
jgi:hypothetical protein